MINKQHSLLRSPSVAFIMLYLLTSAGQVQAAPEFAGGYTTRIPRPGRINFQPSPGPGRDYLDAISDEGIFRWQAQSMPIKVYIEAGDDVPGYRENFPDILRSCFDDWVAASNNRLGWTEVTRKEDANLVCSFTADAPEREGGTEAGRTKTYSKFNTETNEGVIYRGTMRLATCLPDQELSDEQIKKTFLHEVGHAFGLPGHSPNRHDIMYAKVNGSQLPELSASDIATIQRLYRTYPTRTGIASTQKTVDLGVNALNKGGESQNKREYNPSRLVR